jgi:CheY-like chemotaxis protein
MRILIAEDDTVCRIILVNMLKNLGHSVIEAVDGIDLQEKFNENINNVDCIISDVMMPNCSGLEAIRNINKIKKVPSIIVTAVENNTILMDSMGNRLSWTVCELYLSKPINKESLKTVLTNIQSII